MLLKWCRENNTCQQLYLCLTLYYNTVYLLKRMQCSILSVKFGQFNRHCCCLIRNDEIRKLTNGEKKNIKHKSPSI